MISVQNLNDAMLSELDAEGSDRYLFDQDIKPAVSRAVDWLVSVFNAAFSNNKLSEENLRDLIHTTIFQPSDFSRVTFTGHSTFNHKVWSIMGVYPEAEVYPEATAVQLSNKYTSVHRPDLTFIDSDYSAGKLTLEQWNEAKKNVFMSSNVYMSGGLKRYGYKPFSTYESTDSNARIKEIQIRPDSKCTFVGIEYLKYPDHPELITDEIDLPESLFNLVKDRALHYISVKQGDSTNLYSIKQSDVNQLIQIMT